MKQTEELLSVIQNISKKLRELKEEEIKNLSLWDFSFTYYKYIEAIHKLENPTFIELTQELELSKPTVTITVNNLEKSGYVEKAKSPEDGRFYHLSLTSKSKRIIDSHAKMFEKFIKEISSRFNESEIATLIALLKRI